MPAVNDDLYNMDNFMRAIAFVTSKCTIARLEEVAPKYDEVIFEGGQGLMLDQSNMDFFPHLTPSTVPSSRLRCVTVSGVWDKLSSPTA